MRCTTFASPIAVVILVMAFAAPVRAGDGEHIVHVLALYAGTPDRAANRLVDDLLRDSLQSVGDRTVRLHSEHLGDLEPGDRADAALFDYLRAKYGGLRIEVVIAFSDPALQFLLTHRDALFPEAPIVASGTVSMNTRGVRPGLTGVRIGIDYRGTLALIETLHPAITKVLVVARSPNPGLAARIQQRFGDFATRVAIDYITQDSLNGLLDAVKAAPPDSAILFVTDRQQERGHALSDAQLASRVAAAAPVPVYGVSDAVLGSGVVGGVMHGNAPIARRLAAMTLELLTGTPVQDVAIEAVAQTPTFDWRQLQRWKINLSKLPANSDVRFKTASVVSQYGWYLFNGVVLVLLQAAMITALVMQRARRRRSEGRNVAILDAIPDMMFLMTRGGVYVDFHAADADDLLVRAEQFLGRNMREVLPPDLVSRFEAQVARLTQATPSAIVDYELAMPGGARQYEARLQLTRDDQVLAIVRDLTADKRATAALIEAHQQVNRLSRLTAVGEFSTSLGHEVRQPLTAIIMNAQACLRMLDAAPVSNEVRFGLLDIVAAGQRANEVIKRNQELYRHRTVQAGPLDINDVILAALHVSAERVDSSGVTVVLRLRPGLPEASGDRIELQQVMLNLITNAIDALAGVQGAREMTISSAADGDGFIEVGVSDTGVGFATVDVARIFDLSYTTKESGSGVGLSVSRTIVQAHGGRIWAAPNEAGGACFSFTVPIHAVQEEDVPKE